MGDFYHLNGHHYIEEAISLCITQTINLLIRVTRHMLDSQGPFYKYIKTEITREGGLLYLLQLYPKSW